MKTIAIINMKGGVGKTTTAINLSYIMATDYGKRVLLADADGQANATQLLLPSGDYDGMSALLQGFGDDGYDDLIVPTDIRSLDILPASSELWRLDLQAAHPGGEVRYTMLRSLADVLTEDDAYDVMIVDCPPSFSVATINAIIAADVVIIPVLPDAFSATGMSGLVDQIDGVRSFNSRVRCGVLINQAHRADVVSDATDYIRSSGVVPVYKAEIRRTDKVIESTWAGQSVLMWSPRCSASADFRAFAAELAAKEGL